MRNWYDIRLGTSYIFVVRNQGFIYRKVSQNVNERGILTLGSDMSTIPTVEIALHDVLEVWEIKSFVSNQLPAAGPSIDRMEQLVNEMQKELGIKK